MLHNNSKITVVTTLSPPKANTCKSSLKHLRGMTSRLLRKGDLKISAFASQQALTNSRSPRGGNSCQHACCWLAALLLVWCELGHCHHRVTLCCHRHLELWRCKYLPCSRGLDVLTWDRVRTRSTITNFAEMWCSILSKFRLILNFSLNFTYIYLLTCNVQIWHKLTYHS